MVHLKKDNTGINTVLIGSYFKNNLSSDEHATSVLIYFTYLNYFGTRVCCRNIWILYSMRSWGGFLTQTQKGMISAFLRRIWSTILSVNVSISILWMIWTENFFEMFCPAHCFHPLLPSIKSSSYGLLCTRTINSSYQLATSIFDGTVLLYAVFVLNSLFSHCTLFLFKLYISLACFTCMFYLYISVNFIAFSHCFNPAACTFVTCFFKNKYLVVNQHRTRLLKSGTLLTLYMLKRPQCCTARDRIP